MKGALFAGLILCGIACGGRASDGNGYTKIDDMEGEANQVVWTPPGGISGRWGAATACAQQDRILPPPYPVDRDAVFYTTLPASHETFPGVTSTKALWFRTTTPLTGVWGANLTAAFTPAERLPDLDAGAPPDGQPCREDSALNYPAATADLTAYAGITFWARAEAGGARKLLVKINDRNTDPRGGVCNASHPDDDDGCYNGFGTNLVLTDTFARYTLDFSSLAQDPSWGFRPEPSVLDLAHVYVINFEFDAAICAQEGTGMCAGGEMPPLSFDFWLDDLYFVNK
jgi:hypothetical protein